MIGYKGRKRGEVGDLGESPWGKKSNGRRAKFRGGGGKHVGMLVRQNTQ